MLRRARRADRSPPTPVGRSPSSYAGLQAGGLDRMHDRCRVSSAVTRYRYGYMANGAQVLGQAAAGWYGARTCRQRRRGAADTWETAGRFAKAGTG